jgi:DNA modification methylase
MNQLILGDCLEVLKTLASDSVDLIYLDPPFFSNRNYEVIWGDKGEIRSFEDRWSGGVDHYIAWLKERVEEMHRVLKPTGSIFLHCDWHADAYIRVFILDKIFGEQNFRNEIIWKRSYGHGDSKKSLGRSHDVILYYVKNQKKYLLNCFYHAHDPKYIDSFFKHSDKRGIYKLENLTSPSPRPNLTYEYKGYPPPAKGWRVNLEKMEGLDKDGRLHFPSKNDGRIMRKVYLHELEGQPMTDMWTDIKPLSAHDSDRLGYPTQKPEALLERIINMASNEDDIVLDPFNGGGTTVAVADRLNRQWIGISS